MATNIRYASIRRRVSLLAVGLLLASPVVAKATPALGVATSSGPALRFCLDPDNLPFSSAHAGDAGLYTDYGRLIAAKLGRPFGAVWSQSYFGKFDVRTTLLARQCDAFIGLPENVGFMGPKLVFTKPIMDVGFVLAVHADQAISSLDDLKGKTVAVQFGTPAQIMLADYPDIRAETFLSPEEAMAAVANGSADAAFVWGPSAGYAAKKTAQKVRFIPVSGTGMQWSVGIAFPKKNVGLRDQFNQAIDSLAPAFHDLSAKYGLPEETAAPVVQTAALTATATAPAQAAPSTPAPAPAQVAAAAAPTQVAQAAQPGDFAPSTAPNAVAEGQQTFNDNCSHCHGPNAIQSVKHINLRLLHHRYGDRMNQVFYYTVTHGRPDKGMPNWTGALTDDDFAKILAFLHSVQDKTN